MRKLLGIGLTLIIVGVLGASLTFKSNYDKHHETLEETMNMDHIEHVDVNMDNGSIILLPSANKEANIKLTGNMSGYQFKTEIDKGKASINLEPKGIRNYVSFNVFSTAPKLEMEIPMKEYERLSLVTKNGKIEANDLQTKNMHVHTSHGAIDLQKMETEKMDLETSNGTIHVENSEGFVQANTSNGKMKFVDLIDDIQAKTSNGKIIYEGKTIKQNMDFESSNGKIDILTNEASQDILVDAKTSNGTVKVYGEKNWDALQGDGTNQLKLTTSNGNITIDSKE